MAEVKHKVLELVAGVPYTPATRGDVVIPQNASFADIFRYLQGQCGGTLESLRAEVEHYIACNQRDETDR